MSGDPVYMERNALAFFRAWPDVPEALTPVAGRLRDAGLMADGWSLTERGARLKAIIDSRSFNFFTAAEAEGVAVKGRVFKDDVYRGAMPQLDPLMSVLG
jgi:hypothetical protein